MKIFRTMKRLLILMALCVCCAAVMAILPFRNRDESAQSGQGDETIVSWMIDQIAGGELELSDEESIRQAISEGEEKFGISLTESSKTRIVGFMQTLDNVEEGAGDFIDQAKRMYEKYSGELIEEANDAVSGAVQEANDAVNGAVKNAVQDAARSFFQSLIP